MSDTTEPVGYLAWHSWAERQTKAGRKQERCVNCGRWWWPHTKRCRICTQNAAAEAVKE